MEGYRYDLHPKMPPISVNEVSQYDQQKSYDPHAGDSANKNGQRDSFLLFFPLWFLGGVVIGAMIVAAAFLGPPIE